MLKYNTYPKFASVWSFWLLAGSTVLSCMSTVSDFGISLGGDVYAYWATPRFEWIVCAAGQWDSSVPGRRQRAGSLCPGPTGGWLWPQHCHGTVGNWQYPAVNNHHQAFCGNLYVFWTGTKPVAKPYSLGPLVEQMQCPPSSVRAGRHISCPASLRLQSQPRL